MMRLLELVICAVGLTALTQAQAQTEFEPPAGRGRVIVAVSGALGAGSYQLAARKLAQFGYDVFLVDGNGMKGDGGAGLKATIEKAQQSPHALPGKAGVVGFSLGGGIALNQATRWPDQVAVVVAFYPLTRTVSNVNGYVARFKVPILMLAGENDSYHDCCLIETARAIAAAAAERKLPLELVSYPHVDHDFIMAGRNYNATAADDAWQRADARLKQYLN
ncbi:MAG: dienelactone hydrolase family protein [Casimicrobiaceae bacterium]